MRFERLSLLAFLLPVAAITVVACSSDPPKKAKVEKSKEKATSDDDDDDDDKTANADSNLVTAPPAQTAARDAGGLPPPPPNVYKPPPPTTRFCMDLSRCCGNMPDVFQQLACGYAATRGDETACGMALAVCQAGGVDFGGLFGDNNPECAALSQCCSTLQRNYGDASGCVAVVETQDEAYCRQGRDWWRNECR